MLEASQLLDSEAISPTGRTRRSLEEARRAYDARLYLATARLLAAASEGAWFEIGDIVRADDRRVAHAVDDPRSLPEVVQRLIADYLRNVGVRPELVDRVSMRATILRNYGAGVWSGDEDDPGFDRYFDERVCGLLVLGMRDYWLDLAEIARQLSDYRSSKPDAIEDLLDDAEMIVEEDEPAVLADRDQARRGRRKWWQPWKRARLGRPRACDPTPSGGPKR